MATSTKEKLKERSLERMRLGQAVAEIVTIVSDSEIRFALVPLYEADFRMAFEAAAKYEVPDNLAGLQLRDRILQEELLVRSLREVDNLEQRVFDTVEEMIAKDALQASDIDKLIDEYNEMTEKSNPAIDGIPEEEFELLKKVLPNLDWNDLSGRSWYAAKRFLGALIMDGQLRDSLLGSISTTRSTMTKE